MRLNNLSLLINAKKKSGKAASNLSVFRQLAIVAHFVARHKSSTGFPRADEDFLREKESVVRRKCTQYFKEGKKLVKDVKKRRNVATQRRKGSRRFISTRVKSTLRTDNSRRRVFFSLSPNETLCGTKVLTDMCVLKSSSWVFRHGKTARPGVQRTL